MGISFIDAANSYSILKTADSGNSSVAFTFLLQRLFHSPDINRKKELQEIPSTINRIFDAREIGFKGMGLYRWGYFHRWPLSAYHSCASWLPASTTGWRGYSYEGEERDSPKVSRRRSIAGEFNERFFSQKALLFTSNNRKSGKQCKARLRTSLWRRKV